MENIVFYFRYNDWNKELFFICIVIDYDVSYRKNTNQHATFDTSRNIIIRIIIRLQSIKTLKKRLWKKSFKRMSKSLVTNLPPHLNE